MAHIKTYARVKPSKRAYDDYEATATTLYMRIPDILRDSSGAVKTRMCTVNHEFKFTHVFDTRVAQQEVFDTVAKDIIDGFLNGYNGTIFAYGQTGSGKTFTVEGGGRLYEERGLAPRALSMIYNSLEAQPDVEATVHVSYMEIYQEVGYDLLNQAARSSSAVTPFPKVAVVEGTKGSCLVRNLSTHLAANEAVAQSLLLQGQANRKVAETPMNQRSSRSHAVFTIQLTAKKQNDEIITKSKLHLVDLAGSERVSKTGINGKQLAEAKYINLSLHHLEGVIIALHQGEAPFRPQTSHYSSFYKRSSSMVASRSSRGPKKHNSRELPQLINCSSMAGTRPSSADGYRSYSVTKHVPYRNSLLTMVLKDSLGGNCLTAMIATVSMDEENLCESLSTCRFSQRVACITNTVRRNEEIDDKLMIKRLRKRIAELETELALLKSGQGGDEAVARMDAMLTEEDKIDCARIIQSYLGGQVSDPILAGITTPLRFRECMKIFKAMVKSNQTDISRAYSAKPLKAWAEEPARPKTVPKNMKVSNAKSMDDVRPNTSSSMNVSSTSNQSQSINSHSSYRMSHSASDVSKFTSQIASDMDHKMSHMSLVEKVSNSNQRSTSRQKSFVESMPGSRGSSRNSYKTPFERKREKTIKLLAEQVKKKRNEQQEELNHLKEFKTSVMDQQLDRIKNELQIKADENKKLLDAQHIRVKQIKTEGLDEELYIQEKTVERQLRKRQAKMEKRMGLIDQHIKLVHEKQMTAQERDGKKQEEREGEDTDPTKVKGFGTVINSRLVLDKLQEEDKKQQKRQNKMERDRLLTLSQQIELKEAATRQKLRDFKEKLSLSRNNSSLSEQPENRVMESPFQKPGSNTNIVVDLEEEEEGEMGKEEEEEHEPVRDTNNQSSQNPFSIKFDNPFKNMNTHDLMSKPIEDTHPSNRPSRSRESSQSRTDLFQKKEVKNFDELWSKSYTSSRQNSWMDDQRKKDGPNISFASTDPFINIGSSKLESSPIKEAGYEDLPEELTVNSYHDNVDVVNNNDLDYDDELSPRNQPQVKSPREVMKALTAANKKVQNKYQTGPEIYKKTERQPSRGANTDLMMPTEYVNQGHNESFDGSKMGLQHKTFESALQSMLAMEGSEKPGPLTIGKTDYDEFARSNRQDSTPQARAVYSQKAKSHTRVQLEKTIKKGDSSSSNKMKAKTGSSSRPRPSSSDAWGPEAKNISMSDRLSRYLDTEFLPSTRPKAGRSYEDSDVAPYRKPQVLDDSSPAQTWNKQNAPQPVIDLDIDEFTPKIRAVPEKKRETTYMNTVKEQKDRVSKIRRARRAAEVIQRAWANYLIKTGRRR